MANKVAVKRASFTYLSDGPLAQIVIAVIFIIGFGVVGYTVLGSSHAATPHDLICDDNGSGYCLDNLNNHFTKIGLWNPKNNIGREDEFFYDYIGYVSSREAWPFVRGSILNSQFNNDPVVKIVYAANRQWNIGVTVTNIPYMYTRTFYWVINGSQLISVAATRGLGSLQDRPFYLNVNKNSDGVIPTIYPISQDNQYQHWLERSAV